MKEEGKPVSKRKFRMFPQSLASEIEQVVKPLYKQHGFSEHRILTHWPEIVGRELAAGSAPSKLVFPKGKRENGTLHVTVTSGARALELQHMQPQILERIAVYFGYNAIAKITFLQDAGAHAAMPKPRRRAKPVEIAVPNVECADADLKRVLESLGRAVLAKQQS